ncbi:Ger(x)C family spore germination protein [Paenibacillus sp. CF384]|uniref:Ger(x)C family spore germination protein n=1 Tax=Paenibacillus sp. CF384 TaxID=1884382 RepID=UPI0008941BAB|nr:Ger(x)C family spore germination protein [Paenibacillus sp. CF384]SDW06711.1 spore germination protein [Paenibacillus sp. CF384]
MSRLFLSLAVICFLLTGCATQQILDRVTLFIVCAFDEAQNDQIEITIATTRFQSGKPGSISNQLLSKVGYTSVGIRELLDTRLDRPLNSGKLSVVLIGAELAAKGLRNELDMVLRDAQASRRMYLAVVDGRAQEVLRKNFSSDQEKGLYLFNLLDMNERANLVPKQNLHEFGYAFLGKGMDPLLPMLRAQEDQIYIAGLALFKDDKYVMKLNDKQMRVLKLLKENVKRGAIETKLSNGSHVAAEVIGTKVRYRIEKDKVGSYISLNLHLPARIVDSRSVTLNRSMIEQIEASFEQDLAVSGKDLIHRFQKEGIDPLGLGDFVRSKTRNWNEEKWYREYGSLNVQVNVKMDIEETGITK